MANEFIARNGLIAKDSSEITGSLKVTAGVTGSLFGTASWATNLVGGAGSNITIADEGTSQGTATFLNFIGNAVAATVASNTASLTISTGSTVLTVAGTTNEILVNNGTAAVNGAVTLSLPSTVDLGANSSFTSFGLTGSLTASSLVGDIRLGTQTSGQYASTITGGSGLTATAANANDGTAYTIDAVAGLGISLTAPTNDAINIDTGSAHFTGGVTNRLNTLNVLSGSVSSPSQGTISVGGFTNIDLGVQTGDNVTFNALAVTTNITGSIISASSHISGGQIVAVRGFTGSLIGNVNGNASTATTATTATNATNITITDTTTGVGPYYIAFVSTNSGNTGQLVDSTGLTYNATVNGLTTTQITASIISASSGFTGSLFGTASWATNATTATTATSIGVRVKSNQVAASSFGGSPSSSAVTFATAFSNNNYSVTVTGEDARSWTIESKTANGFTINSNSNTALVGNTFWIAIGHGES